jgi:hypothetical protein
MVSATPLASAVSIADRRDPEPVLLVLVTVRVSACAEPARARISPGNVTRKSNKTDTLGTEVFRECPFSPNTGPTAPEAGPQPLCMPCTNLLFVLSLAFDHSQRYSNGA